MVMVASLDSMILNMRLDHIVRVRGEIYQTPRNLSPSLVCSVWSLSDPEEHWCPMHDWFSTFTRASEPPISLSLSLCLTTWDPTRSETTSLQAASVQISPAEHTHVCIVYVWRICVCVCVCVMCVYLSAKATLSHCCCLLVKSSLAHTAL